MSAISNPKTVLPGFVLLLILALATSGLANANSVNDKVLAGLEKSTWIAEGNGNSVVYIFFDPNCPSCQALFKSLRGFVKSGKYQFRWVPVAIVNITSLGKAAAILEAPDPLQAFYKNELNYREYAGGLDEQIPSPDTERKLKFNESLLNGLDIPVIPSMLFADKDNNTILIQGALSPVALRKVFKRLR